MYKGSAERMYSFNTAATIALMGGAAAGGKLTNVGGAASIGASFINDNNKK